MPILKVTDKNVDKFVECVEDKTKPTIILFYASWCFHCSTMKPEWDKATKDFARNKKVNIVEVEHSNLKNIPLKYRKTVQGFPTLRTIKGGKLKSEYYGDRTKKDFNRYITEALEKQDLRK